MQVFWDAARSGRGVLLDWRGSEAKLVMFEHWDVANLQVMKIIRSPGVLIGKKWMKKWHDASIPSETSFLGE